MITLARSGRDHVSTAASHEQQSGSKKTKELDRYSEEFAALVAKYPPAPDENPSAWVRRLPGEVFQYFLLGISTFGQDVQSPGQRRGRLYLLHTALVLMWMKWGRKRTRKQFQSHAKKGTRRAGRFAMLEYYRRGGVLVDYEVNDWFEQPVGEWRVQVVSSAVDPEAVSDETLRQAVRESSELTMTVERFTRLLESGALPSRSELPLS